MIARNPEIASSPARCLAKRVWSAVLNPLKFLRSSFKIVRRLFTFPSLSVRLNPSSAIADADCFVGAASLVNMLRIAVPAFSALMPLFAISPIARAVSSILKPSVPASGATYLNVYPIMPTLVLELVAACASTSAKWPASCACSLNALKASVTISETCPKSSPEAAAKDMIPDRPFSMYSNALPDSAAVN